MDRFKRLTLVPLVLFTLIVCALLFSRANRDHSHSSHSPLPAQPPSIESRPMVDPPPRSYQLDAAMTPTTSESIDLYRIIGDSLSEARESMIPDPRPRAAIEPRLEAPPSASLNAPTFHASHPNQDASPETTFEPADETVDPPSLEWPAEPEAPFEPVDRLPPVALDRLISRIEDDRTADPQDDPIIQPLPPTTAPPMLPFAGNDPSPQPGTFAPADAHPGESITPASNDRKSSSDDGSILALKPAEETIEPLPPIVLEQIRAQIDDGIVLVRKGALYSARNELFHALYMLAEARDTRSNEASATQHLSNAMTALTESDDFVRTRDSGEFSIDLQRTVNRHATAVLDNESNEQITPLIALKRYFEYAQEELINAAGDETIASEALFALGKLYAMPQGLGASGEKLTGPKAIVLFQAAVRINPFHSSAANELAVLLARHGEYATAKRLLLQSLRTESTPAGWHNLAWVHDKLGEHQLAQLAALEEKATRQRNNPPLDSRRPHTTQGVSLVSPEQFDRNRPPVVANSMPEPMPPRTPHVAEQPTHTWWPFSSE